MFVYFIPLYSILRNELQDERRRGGFGDFSFVKFRYFYLRTYKAATGKENLITREGEENRRPGRGIWDSRIQGSDNHTGWVHREARFCQDFLSRLRRHRVVVLVEAGAGGVDSHGVGGRRTPGWWEQSERWRRNLFMQSTGTIFRDPESGYHLFIHSQDIGST